jgi:FkbM family methyltransferase
MEMDLYQSLNRSIRSWSNRSGLTNVKTHSFYARPIRSGSIIVDLGANVGAFTEEMNRRFACVCYAVEPMPDLYSQIRTNDSIQKFNLAITDKAEPVRLFTSTNRECNSVDEGLARLYGVEGVIECHGVTLEEFMKENQISEIDLLKVDIEGAEKWLFQSASDDVLRSAKQITVEFHDFFPGSISRTEVQQICRRLTRLGFYCIPFSFMYPEAETADFLFINMSRLDVPVGDRVGFAFIKKLLQAQKFKARLKRRVTGSG